MSLDAYQVQRNASAKDKNFTPSKENCYNGVPAQTKPHLPRSPVLDRFKLPARYEVRQVIGTGSYGSVCEAFDQETGDLVAVKRVGHLFNDLVDCKRILREISILSKLKHECIVQLYDIPPPTSPSSFQDMYMIMEICDSDMKKLCRTNVTLSELHVNTLLYNLLVGLKYLHSAGIYHRDLKPANCLVNQNCSVKICDFGLSRAVGDSRRDDPSFLPLERSGTGGKDGGRLKRNLTGHVVTRWYRAPELILLQDNYTEAIDMWSVGCIYAELLGMLNGSKFEDRGPLFPGSSCFPLSPHKEHKNDYKYHTRGNHDQLSMIFCLLGTPTEEEIVNLNFNSDARRYIRCFAKRTGERIRSRFTLGSSHSVDMLERMLRFNPAQRIDVEEALEHRLFQQDAGRGTSAIRDKSREICASKTVTLDFEQEPELDEDTLRKYFCNEISAMQRKKSLLACKTLMSAR